MRKYFASMQRMIDLAPAVIVPSHGGPLGGVHYLQKTLDHRRAREAIVRKLHDTGRSIDEMLDAIYVDLDVRLRPLARRNIESHLDKLREEGVVS
jgi:glyoxylase-like metal-dependent hydrolase (beta-lactamase superfamily II)